MNAKEVGQRVLSFASAQYPDAGLISITDNGQFYEVVLSINGQEAPVQVTKDGENLIPQLIPLTARATQETPSEPSTPTPTNIPKSDKPEAQLYVMSHCPYGVEAQKIFMPVMELLGDKTTIQVHFVDYAMHGKLEIDDNNIEYCLQKEQPEAFISFMKCFVESEDSTACLNSTSGIDKIKLDSCIDSTDKQYKITELYNDQSTWLSGRYPQYPVEANLNDQFGVQGSESFIINGVKISPAEYRWDANKMKDLICNAFNTAPEECSQTIGTSSNDGPTAGDCS